VITHILTEVEFEWRRTPPSDLLKMACLYNPGLYDVIKSIRGGFARGRCGRSRKPTQPNG
jgi:hypothetical protein